MTTPLTNNSSNNLPQEDHLQEDILPQEDQRPKSHFQLHTIWLTSKHPFTQAHQNRYLAAVTVNPFQLLDIHNRLVLLEGQLSQMTDTVAVIVNQLHDMTH
jgi:hypothetical protein